MSPFRFRVSNLKFSRLLADATAVGIGCLGVAFFSTDALARVGGGQSYGGGSGGGSKSRGVGVREPGRWVFVAVGRLFATTLLPDRQTAGLHPPLGEQLVDEVEVDPAPVGGLLARGPALPSGVVVDALGDKLKAESKGS